MSCRLGGLQVYEVCFTRALSSPSPTIRFFHNEFEKFANKKRKLNGNESDSLNTESRPRPQDVENSSSPNQAATHPVLLDLQMAERLFKRPLTKGPFDKLKDDLRQPLEHRLRQLSQSKRTCEDVLEMADSAYVLMLLNSSNPKGEEAGRAIMSFQEAVRLITGGHDHLKSAFPHLFTATE